MSCKPFMRLASSILFKRAVDEFKRMSNHKSGVFQLCAKPLIADSELLDEYQNEHYMESDTTIESVILQAAEEKDLFDKTHWDVYQRVRAGIKKYDFLNLFEEPEHNDAETKKRYDTVINQLLLFRKKNYDDLEGAEIVFKNKK